MDLVLPSLIYSIIAILEFFPLTHMFVFTYFSLFVDDCFILLYQYTIPPMELKSTYWTVTAKLPPTHRQIALMQMPPGH